MLIVGKKFTEMTNSGLIVAQKVDYAIYLLDKPLSIK